MSKKQISIALWVIIAFTIASPIIGNTQASQTIIEIYPETTHVGFGDTFPIDVNIIDAVELYALQFVLRYDPNILQVVDVIPGDPVGIEGHVGIEFTGVPTVWDGYDCDVVPDGVLDGCDFIALNAAWLSTPGDPNWNPRADIDNNGWVNILDAGRLTWGVWLTRIAMPGTIQFGPAPPTHDWGTPFSGSVTLATVTFEVIGLGESVLDLDNSKIWIPVPHDLKDGTVTVPPAEETLQHLITTIESWNLPGGTESSLTQKLDAALQLLDQNNINGAKHKLMDFIKQAEAFRGKKLTDEQADYLIACAQAIINAIG